MPLPREELVAYRPRMFVGSSSEGLEVARAFANALRDTAETTVWDEDVSQLGITFSEILGEIVSSFDYALLVLTPDDFRSRRGRPEMAPRDNVVLEIGLFLGRLPRERVFIACPDDNKVALPSDINGVTVAMWDAKRADGNLLAAVRPACSAIRAALNRQAAKSGRAPNNTPRADQLAAPSATVPHRSDLLDELCVAYGKLAWLHASPVAALERSIQTARLYLTQIKHLVPREEWFPSKPELFMVEAFVEFAEYSELMTSGAPAASRRWKLMWARESAETAYRLTPSDVRARELLEQVEHQLSLLNLPDNLSEPM